MPLISWLIMGVVSAIGGILGKKAWNKATGDKMTLTTPAKVDDDDPTGPVKQKSEVNDGR